MPSSLLKGICSSNSRRSASSSLRCSPAFLGVCEVVCISVPVSVTVTSHSASMQHARMRAPFPCGSPTLPASTTSLSR